MRRRLSKILLLSVMLLCLIFTPQVTVAASPGDEVIELRTWNSKTYYLGNNKYSMDTKIGSVHYKDNPTDPLEPWKEIDNQFIPASAPWNWQMLEDGYQTYVLNDFTASQVLKFESQGNTVAFQPMGLLWSNDLNQLQQISMPQDVPVSLANMPVEMLPGMSGTVGTIRWNNAYGAGRHFEWANSPGRLDKLLQLDARPPSPPQYILDGGNPVLKLDFIFAPSSDLDIYVDGQLWDKASKKQTVNNIEFKKEGKLLWTFNPIIYWDSSPSKTNMGVGTTELKKVGNKLYVSALVPYLWLQTAVYPVFIDPTIDVSVGAGADDGYAYSTTFSDWSQLRMGKQEAVDIRTFARFTGVTIPTDGIIGAGCYASFFVWNSTQPGVYLKVKADDLANPNAPTTAAQAFAITPTTAGVDWDDQADVDDWANTPDIQSVIAELQASYDYSAGAAITIIVDNDGSASNEQIIGWAWDYDGMAPKLHIEYTVGGVVAPTVTSQAASAIEATTATGNGTITATGGANATIHGIEWDTNTGAPYTNDVHTDGDFGVGAFTDSLTGLPTGTTIYCRAYTTNTAGTGYGGEVSFLTEPAAPTNVAATENQSAKVVVTWTKSTGATGYKVYEGANLLDTLGDVATFDHTTGDAPTITSGSAVASDGTETAHIALSLSGTSVANGATYTYKVVALNATGDSADSNTDTGYRLASALTYQWNRSAGDSDVNYSAIGGATASTYNDTAAPAGSIDNAGTVIASDGTYSAYVELSLAGESTADGAGRYFTCTLVSTDADNTPQTATANRGYRGVGAITYQWQRSVADSNADYGNIDGATTDPYNDTSAPANGNGRWYLCLLDATGATQEESTHNRGYRATISPGNDSSGDPGIDIASSLAKTMLPTLLISIGIVFSLGIIIANPSVTSLVIIVVIYMITTTGVISIQEGIP